jgi:two-component system invasion response regulator UvrY
MIHCRQNKGWSGGSGISGCSRHRCSEWNAPAQAVQRAPGNPGQALPGNRRIEASAARRNMARIVLIEPSRRDFIAVRRFLQSSGHQCDLHFKFARQALSHLKVGDFDLLVVTLELPDIHGLELVAMLRRAGQLVTGTPVLVCSSLGSPLNIQRAIRGGVSGFLLVDDRPALIARAIDAVLAGGTIFPEQARLPLGDDPRCHSALVFPTHLVAVLHGLHRGITTSSLAEHLALSGASIGQHKRQLMRKLSADNLDELFRISEEIGLLQRRCDQTCSDSEFSESFGA